MNKDSKIYIAGHTGLLGSALMEELADGGFGSIVTRSHEELDLTNKDGVFSFFSAERPEYVFLAAGKVGGIIDNKIYPAEYLRVNLAIQNNVFEAAREFDVKNLVFYGSSCTYPKECPQPMKEESLLAGMVEETSLGYAAAKIAGLVGCRVYNEQYGKNRFIALTPNSMYGPNDNFDLDNCHVLSALLRRFHEAKASGAGTVTLWGSGRPRREFIYSRDAAAASLFAVQHSEHLENHHYNIGTGTDYSIKELASIIAEIVDYRGEVLWDKSKPDGAPRKLLDSTRFLSLGWKPETDLRDGLQKTYQWYRSFCRVGLAPPNWRAKAHPTRLMREGSMQETPKITAVILAGGFGTRLRSVVCDRPKVLAEVSGRPFLAYLLDQLSSAGLRTVVISTGYMAETIEECFGDSHGPLHIVYSKEDEPLGTAGALRLALRHLASETVLVMNGDSFIDADLNAYASWFFEQERQAALLLAKVADTRRFGSVNIGKDNIIVSFEEKSKIAGPGWINAGVYLLKKSLVGGIEQGKCCSLERDFFPKLAGKDLFGYCVERRFIDIGTPQSYAAAEHFFCSASKEA